MRWDIINREIDEILYLGIIEPSVSEWQNPIILIPKLERSVMFCVDYREVNKAAAFDANLMPRANVLLDHLGSAVYLTAIDLTDGYWQVPMVLEDKPKMAFAAPTGLYQFTQIPFGLHEVVSTFQWLVDHDLQGCQAFAHAYIDDIIVGSQAASQHQEEYAPGK